MLLFLNFVMFIAFAGFLNCVICSDFFSQAKKTFHLTLICICMQTQRSSCQNRNMK